MPYKGTAGHAESGLSSRYGGGSTQHCIAHLSQQLLPLGEQAALYALQAVHLLPALCGMPGSLSRPLLAGCCRIPGLLELLLSLRLLAGLK